MDRAQAIALIAFIKYSIRFFNPHGLSPSPSEYLEAEELLIKLLTT